MCVPLTIKGLFLRASNLQMSPCCLPVKVANVTVTPYSNSTGSAEKLIESENVPLGYMPAAHFRHLQLSIPTSSMATSSYVKSALTKKSKSSRTDGKTTKLRSLLTVGTLLSKNSTSVNRLNVCRVDGPAAQAN